MEKRLQKLSGLLLGCSEISAQECVYTLLSMPVSHSSRETIFINTYPKADRSKMLLSNDILLNMKHCSTNIYVKGLVDHYVVRPKGITNGIDFDNMCLAEFAGWFKYVSNDVYNKLIAKKRIEKLNDLQEEDDDFYDEIEEEIELVPVQPFQSNFQHKSNNAKNRSVNIKKKQVIMKKQVKNKKDHLQKKNSYSSIPFKRGLRNFGITCFMNSCLQSFFSNKRILTGLILRTMECKRRLNNFELLTNNNIDLQILRNNLGIVENFIEGVKTNITDTDSNLEQRNKLKELSEKFFQTFNLHNQQQQDCMEFFQFLLDSLESIYSITDENMQRNRLMRKNYFKKYYLFEYDSFRTCIHCRNTRHTQENDNYMFSLGANNHTSILESLKEQFYEEDIPDFFCNYCEDITGCKILKRLKFDTLGDVLILQILRYIPDEVNRGHIIKLSHHINIPMVLNLRLLIENDNSNDDSVYDIAAVIFHQGPNLNCGHYTGKKFYLIK